VNDLDALANFGERESTSDDTSISLPPRKNSARSPDVDRSHHELGRLAALARIAEAMAGGDLRVLVCELRQGLERLAGPVADVVPIRRK
jgi:hypothetical protein